MGVHLLIYLSPSLFPSPYPNGYETDYYYYSQIFAGKTEDAVKILTYLRGDSTKAREELKEYSMNSAEKIPWRELLKDSVFLKTIGIVVFLAISSQMTGYNAVQFYLQIIFESTGTSVAPEISSVIIGCIQVFACICTILLTDKFGRKPVLVMTFFWLAVGLVSKISSLSSKSLDGNDVMFVVSVIVSLNQKSKKKKVSLLLSSIL